LTTIYIAALLSVGVAAVAVGLVGLWLAAGHAWLRAQRAD
jgi:hypothetical protein